MLTDQPLNYLDELLPINWTPQEEGHGEGNAAGQTVVYRMLTDPGPLPHGLDSNWLILKYISQKAAILFNLLKEISDKLDAVYARIDDDTVVGIQERFRIIQRLSGEAL